MNDYFKTYSTFYAAPCRFEGMDGYDVIQIRDKDKSFACRQWCESLDWLEDEKLVMTDRNTLEEIYRGEYLFETDELAEDYTITIMKDLSLIEETSGGGEETPMLGVASYTNCVGYTCPPEGPAGQVHLPGGKTSAAHIFVRDTRHAEQIHKERHGTRRKIYQSRCDRTVHSL